MKVTLLGSYSNFSSPEFVAHVASSTCVGKTDSPSPISLQHATASGHLSVLEHLPMSFLIEDVSRSLTHQLVRHRHASYSQQSQRYSKVNTDEQWYVIPDSIKGNDTALGIYLSCMNTISDTYNNLLDLGIKKEDARYILPNATYTTIVMSCNARAFIEQCKLRLCNRAQWEIRAMYTLMKEKIKDIYPSVYELCVPSCATKVGCQEYRSCGHPWKKETSCMDVFDPRPNIEV